MNYIQKDINFQRGLRNSQKIKALEMSEWWSSTRGCILGGKKMGH